MIQQMKQDIKKQMLQRTDECTSAVQNPYEDNGKWYWYDETTLPYGPYETKEQAQCELQKYVDYLLKLM